MTAKRDEVVCRSCKSGRARSGGENRQGGRDGGSGNGGGDRDGVLGAAIREGAETVLSGASREVGVEKAGKGRIYKGKLTELIWSGKAGRGGARAGTRGGIGGSGPNKHTPKSVGTRGCEWIGDGTLSAVMPPKMDGSTGGANERASQARRSGGKRERMGISSSSTSTRKRSGSRSTGLR